MYHNEIAYIYIEPTITKPKSESVTNSPLGWHMYMPALVMTLQNSTKRKTLGYHISVLKVTPQKKTFVISIKN